MTECRRKFPRVSDRRRQDRQERKAVLQYAERYLEPEARGATLSSGFDHVLVVPARREAERIGSLLSSIPQSNVLVVLVLNHTKAESEARAALLGSLESAFPQRSPGLRDAPFGALFCLDVELRDGDGVGRARKIGLDTAFRLWCDGCINSPWLHSSDADARLPRDFFATDHADGAAVSLSPYWHEGTASSPIAAYEIRLRHYALGLRFARSPFAYQSIGSTISVDPVAYAKVRGMPKREAAEDFHFLNKLRKVGAFVRRQGEPVVLDGRTSDRVPFGTGRAMLDAHEGKSPRLHAPRSFALLRRLIAELNRAETTGVFAPPTSEAKDDWRLIEEALRLLGYRDKLDKETRKRGNRGPWVHQWFDALRTLRFIHSLRDLGVGDMAIAEGLGASDFVALAPTSPTLRMDMAKREWERDAELERPI